MSENSPTPLAFAKASWTWFKRNFTNIILVIIAILIWATANNLNSILLNIFKIQWDVEAMRNDLFDLKLKIR